MASINRVCIFCAFRGWHRWLRGPTEGCASVRQLHAELRDRGYRGSSPRGTWRSSNAARHGVRTSDQSLDDWLAAVEADDQPDLHSFARGIRHDYDAVRNGLSLPWNSGVVEGTVSKIKMIKRQMYRRASFLLLRKRVLAAT